MHTSVHSHTRGGEHVSGGSSWLVSNEGQGDIVLDSETQSLGEEYKYHHMPYKESSPEGEMLNHMVSSMMC